MQPYFTGNFEDHCVKAYIRFHTDYFTLLTQLVNFVINIPINIVKYDQNLKKLKLIYMKTPKISFEHISVSTELLKKVLFISFFRILIPIVTSNNVEKNIT